LPPHWSTLYELTRLSDEEFQALLVTGVIRPGMEREELAMAVAKRKRRPPPPPLINDIEGDELQILPGDCMARLKRILTASIDCVITSPPYYRTLVYPGAFTVFGGDSCCDHDWEMRSENYGGWHQRTTGLNDRHKTKNETKTIEHGTCRKCGAKRVMLGWEETVEEYIDHLVQVFAEVKRVLKPGGVFWLNIGDKVVEKDSLDIPERLLLALKNNGWMCPAKITWHILNKMPSSVEDRPNCDYEMAYMFVKQTDYYFGGEEIREPAKCADDLRRGTRINYTGKYDGTTGFGQQSFVSIREDGTRNPRSVWSIPSDRLPEYSHCCPFPKELVRRMVLAGCPSGGVVLDFFAGSGTTGLVANALGRRAVLIEANPQFAAEAEKRIEEELPEYTTKCAGEDAWGNAIKPG
jgi:DNA modification methylase